MKRLILIRHAKSSWSDPSQPDKSRPLNARGREAATAIGAWIGSSNPGVDEVLVSPAARCRETWATITDSFSTTAPVLINDALYLANEENLLDVLRTATGDCVVMIAHMPGIGAFARALRRDPPPMHEMFKKYPTGAATVLDFRVDNWRDAQTGTGVFVDYVCPRDMVSAG